MKRRLVEGIVKRHPDGFGFLIADDPDQPDIYLPRHEMTGVMSQDRLRVEVFPEPRGDRFRGEVKAVVARAHKKVVGKLHLQKASEGLLLDESHAWGASLHIAAKDLGGAKADDLVAAEILTYPSEEQSFTGRVVEVIGDVDDPLNDVKRVIHSQNIPNQFSPGTLQEAHNLGHEVSDADIRGRRDLRHLNFVTIDGVTARDFDDAIYVESNAQGFRLWVAIADVSHYVKPQSAVDKDAYERGTSVYFPNFVVPMLPEALSNELCSLKPHVPRLTLVAEMQMNHHGEKQKSEFYEAVIESKARVTYGEAQELIDGNAVEKIQHVRGEILRAADLARVLMAKRFREGSLDLDVPESQVQIDEAGNPVDIVRSERLFAHRLIEELMLSANVAVAEYFGEHEIAALYRIHEEPAPEAIENLQRFLYNFGGERGLGGGMLQTKITRALQGFAGKPQAEILNILTLRTMKQARYSPNNVGHFGLGFANYSHFTSPIRRYPDLIVHRLVKSLLHLKGYRQLSEEDLATAGTMLSACEQRAVKAERQLISIKKARFMHSRVGEEFDGTISSVAKFGVFVLLRDFDVDGLVKIEALSKTDRFEYDNENLRLVGKRSGESYEIGDPIRVLVAACDIEAAQIDFVLAEEQPEKAARPARVLPRQESSKRGKPKFEEGKRDRRPKRDEAPQREERRFGRDRRGGDRRRDGREDRDERKRDEANVKVPVPKNLAPFEKFMANKSKAAPKKSVREQFLERSQKPDRDGDENQPRSRKLMAASTFAASSDGDSATSGSLVRRMKVSTRGVKLQSEGGAGKKKAHRKGGGAARRGPRK
jgi:ribonuclease R